MQKVTTLQPGSKGGYFTEKSPKMLLLEWCNQQKRPKPRYKVMAAAADTMRCKVCFARCLRLLCAPPAATKLSIVAMHHV